MNNLFSQKGILVNLEVQNKGKVCLKWILWQEKKSFTVLMSIQISIRVEESMNDVGKC